MRRIPLNVLLSAVLFGITMAVLAAAICVAVAALCCLTRARSRRRRKTAAAAASAWPGSWSQTCDLGRFGQITYNPLCSLGGQEDFGRRGGRQQQHPPGGNCNYSSLHQWHEGGNAHGKNASNNSEAPPPAYSEAVKY